MAEPKTKETNESVTAFLKKITDKTRRDDCLAVVDIMRKATGEEPKMWGSSIVGFGRYRYKYPSGREAEWMLIGFSPRKSDLTLYVVGGVDGFPAITRRLGKFKTGKSCLYVKKLADVDTDVLRDLVKASISRLEGQRIRR